VNHCRRSLERVAGSAAFIGIVACAGSQRSGPNTAQSVDSRSEPRGSTLPPEPLERCDEVAGVEQVVRDFDAAWAKNDVEAVVALFAPDATLESPLVPVILKRAEGVLRGGDEIREMVSALIRRGTPWGKHEPPLVRGDKVAIEFRTTAPDAAQFYSVDMLEIREGKIQSLRAYSGWRALRALSGADR
jgi:ketosteroid isomerase-like protein